MNKEHLSTGDGVLVGFLISDRASNIFLESIHDLRSRLSAIWIIWPSSYSSVFDLCSFLVLPSSCARHWPKNSAFGGAFKFCE